MDGWMDKTYFFYFDEGQLVQSVAFEFPGRTTISHGMCEEMWRGWDVIGN